jgi:hypothetical protein
MAGVKQMSERMRTIVETERLSDGALRLRWSDGITVSIQLHGLPGGAPTLGEWGHSLEWPNGDEVGADRLWLETLSALGRDDARQFLEWRLHNDLSLAKAAEALGLARRTVAYYSNGDRPVPKAILLACKGWDASPELRRAA